MKRYLLLCLLIPLLGKAQLNADGVITIGRNALYYEDYALSIQYFNQVIQAKPYLYEPYYYRAVAKYYLGDYTGAASDCSLSIERDPFIDDVFRLRAISYIMNAEYAKASDDYRLLLSRRNDDKDVWYNLVLCQTSLDSLATADALLDTMILKWPSYTRCYMLKAQIAFERADTVSADTLIERTLQIDPYDVDALGARGMLQMNHGAFADAEKTYDRAIVQSPKKSGFYLNRAMARFRQNNLRGAMDDYNIALDIDPDNYPGHYNRGLLRMQVGENNLAIEDFNFVLKREPHDRLALFNRALLLEKTGDFKGAINDYTTVLEDYPNFWTGYENRAKCYRLAGMNKQALADERKVYIARLDDMFGTAKRNRQKPTRKQKEQDIDDYKKMVVENDDENIAKFYASDYRGRIQNRDVVIEQQPLYLLTFTPRENGLTARLSYAQFLEQFNNSRVLSRPLYLASHEEALDADGIRSVDEEARQLANRLSHQQRDTRLLFAHAFCTSSKRDYTAAIDDLNQALSLDSTFVAALFLRAVVREKQLETYRSKQHKETGLQSEDMRMDYRPVIADLSNAIRQEPACAFFYYNRGCIYSRIKADDEARRDYDKAIQLNPSLAEAYYNRGLLLVGQQNYQDGFADLSKAGELGIYSAYSLIKHFRRVQQGKK